MQNKVAFPMVDGKISGHFGHSEQFVVVTIRNGEVVKEELLSPPEHTHGSFPRFLAGQNVDTVVVGGIGAHAIEIFNQNNIKVITGAPAVDLNSSIQAFISGNLITTGQECNHHHHDHNHDHQNGHHRNY